MPLLEARFSQDKELRKIWLKIEEVMQGREFVATEVWRENQPDGGPSLQTVQENTPIGGCTLSGPGLQRWRQSFNLKSKNAIGGLAAES